jgi:prefoldin subunit 5
MNPSLILAFMQATTTTHSTYELIPIGLVIAVLAVAVGYGELRMKTQAAHRRIDEHREELKDHKKNTEEKLDAIAEGITQIRIRLGITENHS